MTSAVSGWAVVPRAGLESLAHALEAGSLRVPCPPPALERHVGRELSGYVASELIRLRETGFSEAQAALLLRLLVAEREAHAVAQTHLVWSGPEGAVSASRDTGVLVPELFASARRSVLVAGFAIYQGKKVFERLAANMDANTALSVRIFTNISRPKGDGRTEAELVREFAHDFRRHQWPGERLPALYYDPRALSGGSGSRACLHAKCLIVDDERALVTSANFTEAALDRNIEAGVLIEDAGFAQRLRGQFDTLVASRQLVSVPGLG